VKRFCPFDPFSFRHILPLPSDFRSSYRDSAGLSIFLALATGAFHTAE